MTKTNSKPFIEEWRTTRYIHFILFLLSLIIGIYCLLIGFWLDSLLSIAFSMFLFGSLIAYEDVYRELKKEEKRNKTKTLIYVLGEDGVCRPENSEKHFPTKGEK